jgi:hypothetical protein
VYPNCHCSHITLASTRKTRPALDLPKSRIPRRDQDSSLVLVIEVVRLRFCRDSFRFTAFDNFGLDGRLVVLAVSFLVALILILSVFFVFLVKLGFAIFLLLFVDYNALLGFVGVGVGDGGLGTLDGRIGGADGVGRGFGARFALFGRGSCGVGLVSIGARGID